MVCIVCCVAVCPVSNSVIRLASSSSSSAAPGTSAGAAAPAEIPVPDVSMDEEFHAPSGDESDQMVGSLQVKHAEMPQLLLVLPLRTVQDRSQLAPIHKICFTRKEGEL